MIVFTRIVQSIIFTIMIALSPYYKDLTKFNKKIYLTVLKIKI